jgi:protein-disulfide isomerase
LIQKGIRVHRLLKTLPLLVLTFCFPGASLAVAQQPAPPSAAELQKKVEAFLRHFYALGSEYQINVGTPTELGATGLLEIPIQVNSADIDEKLKMYLTKDGRYLFRGEISDLTKDPLTENLALIQTAGAPVWGDPKALITLIEFSDFECPVCRNLHDALRGLLPNYPQVKVIFKDFPLDAVHPWARTAALAGRCAYQQDPQSFWKLYDLIYDKQDLISAANVWEKMLDFAGQAQLNQDTFKACLAGPQAAAEVQASIANGNLLEVRSTPTVFVNGRKIVGADPHAIQQYIDYELAQIKSTKQSVKH